ncbi:hypothetical protein FACS18942_01390 [Planctomycetales bacterium]|nr:hypothetical protein FACS18942_01390 [Planctomycetales bacterium]GHT34912.1 hypothetical protein FACS189427_03130 [Planctomycetales bacterium]
MYNYNRSFAELLKKDKRYSRESYAFVCEALEYAQNVLKLGKDEANEPISDELLSEGLLTEKDDLQSLQKLNETADNQPHQHISGQDLCRAARDYAIKQYGLMAEPVLYSLGIRKTGDIGEIVYNLIRIGQMRKTPADSREDFDNVFDFGNIFKEEYRFKR